MAYEKTPNENPLDTLDRDTEYGLRRPNTDYRPPLVGKQLEVQNAWGNDPIPPDTHMHKAHKGAKIFFIISCAICALVVLFALVKSSIFSSPNANSTIDIAIDAPPFVDGGSPTTVSVSVANKGTVPLELTDLILSYPEPTKSGVTNASGVSEATSRVALKDIAIGATATHDYSVVLYGAEGDQLPITATLEYHVPNSNAIFTKTAKVSVQIRSTPLNVVIDSDTSVVAGQTVPYRVIVTNKSPNVLNDLIVDAVYPPGFSFVSSDPQPLQSNHLWNIESIDPGASATITIRGIITAQPLESKVLRASAGTHNIESNQIAVLLNTGIKTVTINQPFIETNLTLDGTSGDQVPLQENISADGEVTITNSLVYPINNVVAKVVFDGGLYNPAGIQAKDGGFFDSNTKTITWQGGDLASLAPGETATLSFIVTPKQSGSSKTLRASLSLSAVVQGGTQPSLADIQTVGGILATSLSFDAKTQYGGSGPIPPKVGQKTKYNLVFDVANNVNQIGNAILTTILPQYVTWEGSTTANLSYNDITRTVTWTIPVVPAGAGYTGNPVHGSFAVSITPSTSQVDDTLQLTGQIEITGTDSVAHVEVRHRRTDGLRTTLSADPTYGSGKGQVVQ